MIVWWAGSCSIRMTSSHQSSFSYFPAGGAEQCWRRFATQVSTSFRLPRRVFTVKDMFTTLLVPWNLKTKLLVIGRKDPYTVEQSPDPTLAILVKLCHRFVTIVSLLRHRAIIARVISHEFDTVTHLFPPTKVWLSIDLQKDNLPNSCFRSEIIFEIYIHIGWQTALKVL